MESNNLLCDICSEDYNRKNILPLKLSPCGHKLCKKCVNDWFVINQKNSCPFCRGIVDNNTIDDSTLSKLKLNFNYPRSNEILKDYSNIAVYVINNNIKDISDASTINEIKLCPRWKAAVYNLIEVARYNIDRGIYALYYILNPTITNYWELNRDFVIIDSMSSNKMEQLNILKDLLSVPNIRRHQIFNNIPYNIAEYLKYIVPAKNNITISYNFITDDIPSISKLFENSLGFLSSEYKLFISIILYTSNPTVSLYYGSLYNRLSDRVLYVDIVRDYFIDATLFYNSQRKIVLYTSKLHIARMAGCYYPTIYGCTTCKLSSTNIFILIKNLINIPDYIRFVLPRDKRRFLSMVVRKNYSVFNVLTQNYSFIIDTKLLSHKISRIQYRHSLRAAFKGAHHNSVKLV